MAKKLEAQIPMSKRTKVAKRLLALRKARQWSQRDLAAEFYVTPGAVMLWEKGERSLSGPALRLLEIYEKEAKTK